MGSESNTIGHHHMTGSVHKYGGVWGNVNSGPGTQYNFHGRMIYVNIEAAHKIAQHQPNRSPVGAVGRSSELGQLRQVLADCSCVVKRKFPTDKIVVTEWHQPQASTPALPGKMAQP